MSPYVIILALVAVVIKMFTSDKEMKKRVATCVTKAMKNAHNMSGYGDGEHLLVNTQMQRALCCPLTPEEVEIINSCTFCDQKRFSYTVQNVEVKKNVYRVTVLVTAVFSAPHLDLRVNHQNVPVIVTCMTDRDKGLHVTQVERG